MNKGFSLMELMLVLALISILAIITVPMILNALTSANEKAFLDTALTINKAAANYYAETAMDDSKPLPLIVTYEDSKVTYKDGSGNQLEGKLLDYKGKHPTSGSVYIETDGTITMAIFDNRASKCIEKEKTDKVPEVTKTSKENCYLKTVTTP